MQSSPRAQSVPWLFWIVVAAVLILAAMCFGAMFIPESSAKAVAAPTPALTVTVASAQQANWTVTIDASGAIAPWQEASVSTQTAGLRIIEVRADVGDVVKRGQLLARFDADTLRAEEAQLKASVAQAQASATQADLNHRRVALLKVSGAISERDFLQDVTQADMTEAQLAVVRAQLLEKQLQLRYADVLAPDDGVVSLRNAMLGAVAPSGDELFRLIRQNRLEWRGELTAAQLARIAPGQIVTLSLPDGHKAMARVRMMAPTIDSQSRLGLVYAEIEPGSRARAGMYASGRIEFAPSNAVVVPASSVVIRDGRSYVFLIGDTDVATTQAVTVGRRQKAFIEIEAGLLVGQRIAVQGAGFLNDGDVVRVAGTGLAL